VAEAAPVVERGVMSSATADLKVLLICHNHPALYPGGTEAYALETFKEMQASDGVDPLFLARVGNTASTRPVPHPGTPFSLYELDSRQYFIHSDLADFDWLNLSSKRKELFTTHLREFLLTHQPDVVHVHHTLYLGIDLLREIRNTLPNTPIVHSLHEYRPICHRDGVMVRTRNDELCTRESPRRCNECFPEISQEEFFMRKLFIQSHLAVVDLFLAPSEFLLKRYVDWGLPREKIRYHEHGRPSVEPAAASDRPARNRLGYFGQLNPYKGVTVLLEAMQVLSNGGAGDGFGTDSDETHGTPEDVHLSLYGANLEWQSGSFQNEFHQLAKTNSASVTLGGSYDESDLPHLMEEVDWVVAPSVWWENSPLVIQEAFQYGRPVICSGIGALAEKVTDGLNGLHFRAGDPTDLAETIKLAVSSPGLWEKLRAGIPQVRRTREDVESLVQTYRELIETRKVR
jgi:glycosyltransferase involved in cell wall biosynthesis